MRARLVVFPIRGRNWCFSRSIDPEATLSDSIRTPTTFKQLWNEIRSRNANNAKKSVSAKTELVVDFACNKMNKTWTGFEKAPAGSIKNKIHGLGLKLLAGVKPSEVFLKSINKEVTNVEVNYPSSLNPRLVRRRLRHIAMRGTIVHEKYLYGSCILLPLSLPLAVLPLPNVPFFWILFRTYSHWRAWQGSQKLLKLVSDSSLAKKLPGANVDGSEAAHDDTARNNHNLAGIQLMLQPSKELDQYLERGSGNEGLSERVISDICGMYDLDRNHVLKYRDSL